MQIGIVGKSNVGKSTFFKAATLVDIEISNRIFTTIKPNQAVAYVTKPCVCRKHNVTCKPVNSKCVDGIRMIPIKLIDVAGLVPDAHKGKGLGIQFLNDLMACDITDALSPNIGKNGMAIPHQRILSGKLANSPNSSSILKS